MKVSAFFLPAIFAWLIVPVAFAGSGAFDKGLRAFDEAAFEEAQGFFERALKVDDLDPSQRAEANKRLALIAVGRKQNARAEQYLLQVLPHDPGFDPAGHRIFGAPKFVSVFRKMRRSVDIISIDSSPRGAQVAVDDLPYGQTPCHLVLEGGRSVRITVYTSGSQPFAQGVIAVAGGSSSLMAKLRIIPGGIMVKSRPTGAKVLLDGAEVGVTPISLDDLAPKTYTLALHAEGYKKEEQSVRVQSAKISKVDATLERKAAPPTPPIVTATKKVKGKRDSGKAYRAVGWSLLGVSAASLATSGVFYARTLDYIDKVNKTDDPDDYDKYSSSGKTAMTITYVTAGLGVAAGVASGFFLYRGYTDSPGSAALYRPILSAGYDGRKMRLKLGFIW